MATERWKIVFMGVPEFAVPCLRALHDEHEVLAVVTQPDRLSGRGLRRTKPPVKALAEQLGLPVLQPETLRRRSVREELAGFKADIFVVVAFGQILRPRVLTLPRHGCLNVHASLLPRYRGAAPIQWAVLDGEAKSGVTIMELDAGIDTGPMLLQREIPLAIDETAGTLHDRLAPLGARLLMEAIEGLQSGAVKPRAQDHSRATEARMLTKADGKIDFSRQAREVDRWIRGLDPWPGAYVDLGEAGRLKLYNSRFHEEAQGAPGEVLAVDDRGALIACGEGGVWVGELQPAGKRRMSAAALAAGRGIARGVVLGA
ncbi:MAG: methionyl-tRNA formyltransferase [Deltaproteobacteria bacterium]|nr:methionyl-tRNA formyltransferase [Deltaproteobacteria bacterium]